MRKIAVLSGISIISLFVLIMAMINPVNETDRSSVKVSSHQEIAHSVVDERTVNTSLTLNAVGDILIHDRVYDGAHTDDGFDFKSMLEPIKPYLEGGDLIFANQETILGGEEIGLSGYPTFNSPFEVGDALKYAGVDIVSIANNHTLDRGEEAVMNATNYLNDIGIDYVGGYQSDQDQQTKRVINKNGISVGFLAYTYGTNGIPIPDGKDYLVNLIDEQRIIEDIHNMQEETDFVIVSMHFGQEYQPLPNDEQIHLTELLTSEGADVILGHHPHVLQPIDWFSFNDQNQFVIYSLGNFLSGQRGLERKIGAISQVELTKEITKETISYDVVNAKVMPTYNYYEDHEDVLIDLQVMPLIEADEFDLDEAEKLFDDTVDHIKSFSSDVKIVPYFD
ncbi:CapA family protein [Alkalibacillus silvisoli]|uniref:CapA family protein n=1 Tax=Alkalibacillus silvisoli TaxID=392823 RepID=A0ABN0ZXD0_9BACI